MGKSLALLGALVVAGAARASVVWKGDFSTGDFSQWSQLQEVSPDRLQLVTSPTRNGKYALKVTVKQGDNPINASGNRNELEYDSFDPMGSEYFYKWSSMFDANFPSDDTWQLFVQWHPTVDCCGSPIVQFLVQNDEVRLTNGYVNDTVIWGVPLVRSVWHDFVFHVKWSDDPKVGFVEVYYDGKLALPKTMMATNWPGQRSYLKAGLYRDAAVSRDGVLWFDGMIQATELADVMPPPAAPPDSGVAPPPPPPTPDAGAVPPPASRLDAGSPGEPDAGMPAGADAGIEPQPDVPDAGLVRSDRPPTPAPDLERPPPRNGVRGTPEAGQAGCSTSGDALSLALVVLGALLFFTRKRSLPKAD